MKTETLTLKDKHRGVTLVELMVVIVLIAIISAIAYPSYTAQVLKANRMDAKRVLMQIQSAYERYYVEQSNVYNTNANTLGNVTDTYSSLGLTPPTSSFYTFSCPGCTSGTAYTLRATASGQQASDTDCLTLQITNTGARTATSTTCW